MARLLSHHEVTTAYKQGWDTLENGDLLAAAEAAGFQVFVTTDKNLRYQQDLASRKIAIVVISTNKWHVIREHPQLVVDAVDRATPSSFREIDLPRPSLRRRAPDAGRER